MSVSSQREESPRKQCQPADEDDRQAELDDVGI